MACTGSPATLDDASCTGAACQNTITAIVSAPCGSSGYYVNLYRGPTPGALATYPGPADFISSTALPSGPFSSVAYVFTNTPPCARGAYTYTVSISCGSDGASTGSINVNAPAQGGPASITASACTLKADCTVENTVQISKPCGECAGSVKLFRNGVQIYSTVVPEGPLIGWPANYTDTPGDGNFSYIWKVYNENGTVDDESPLRTVEPSCNIVDYDPQNLELPAGELEKHIVLVRVNRVGPQSYVYTDYQMLHYNEQRTEWWYHKNGGCGAFRILTHELFPDIMQDVLGESWEIHIRIKVGGQTHYSTWYRGVIRAIRSEEQGAEQFTDVRGYGYVEMLDNVQVQRKYPAGMTVKQIVDDIMVRDIVPNTRIVRPIDIDPTNGDYGTDASSYTTKSELHFECSALKAIKFLAELQGSREFGVDADRKFYFRAVSSTVSKSFFEGNDILERVAGGKTFVQANELKVAGKAFGSTNFLQIRPDVTDISNNGLYESPVETPWITGDADASQWADNIIAKSKGNQAWSIFEWKFVDERLDASHPIGMLRVYGGDVSNDFNTYEVAKIQYIEGGWTSKNEIREMGQPQVAKRLDQPPLKARFYLGYYPRDIVEELEVRLREQIEFLKGRWKQFRYPNDVTNLPSTGHIPGELLHYSKDVTNNDVVNSSTERQDLTNPRGTILTWLDKQWTKLSTRRTFSTLPTRGKFIGEVVSLITDLTSSAYGVLYWWTGIAWSVVGSGASSSSSSSTPIIEGARVQKTTDTTISPGGTTISFDGILANDNGVFFIGLPTRLTAQTDGYFAISANVLWGKGLNGTYKEIHIKKTSGVTTTIIAKERRDDFVHNVQRAYEVGTVIRLLAGDYVELICDTDAVDGGTSVATAYPTGEFSAIFTMALFSGGGTASTAVGNPTGPAGGDLSGTYPSPQVEGLQGDALPTMTGDGFIKRNVGNTAWENVDYTNIRSEYVRTGLHKIRIDEWADPTNTVTYCDVTNNPVNIHGLVPSPTGWQFDVLKGTCRFEPSTCDDINLKAVSVYFNPQNNAQLASDNFLTATGTGTASVVSVVGRNYHQRTGAFNNPGEIKSSSSQAFSFYGLLDYFIDYRTGAGALDLTDTRLWIVLDNQALTTYQLDNPSTAKIIGFRFSNSTSYTQPGTDTHWMAYSANGASSSVVDTGITPQLDTTYEFYIDMAISGTARFYINRALVATIASNVPTSSVAGSYCSYYLSSVSSSVALKAFRYGKLRVRWR